MRRLVALFLALAAACGGESSTGPSSNTPTIVGTWDLKTVNGQAVPFVIAQIGLDKIEILSETYTFVPGGAFTQITSVRLTQNGAATTASESDAGTYTLNGSAVSLRWNSDGSTGTASLSGNTLTAAEGGFSAVYQRR